MRRETLIDVFDDLARLEAPFVSYDDGYRSWDFTYRRLAGQARAVALLLRERGIAEGDKVLLWGENRPGWVAALWGCLLEGVVAVPIDYRSTAQFLERVHGVVNAKLLFAGEEVTPPAMPVMRLQEVEGLKGIEELPGRPEIHRDDVAEILFTSGATAEPKGVLITHKNLMANLGPVEGEVRKYRAHPAVKHFAQHLFFPIRFLNLLPLSHLFGQSMATFIPPTIDGQVLFLKGHNPHEIVRQIARRRVSVLVCVPKILEVLRDYVIRHAPEAAQPMPAAPAGKFGFLKRWRHYRRVHRLLGWKFWAFVVGAAPLDPELEEFWKRMGYVVIQGYGLTETAPIVSLNHPFHTQTGSVGKPIAGVEVKVAEDGEILVRGDNVTQGYYGGEAGAFDTEGWFHTGDIGVMDAEGRLSIRGRKKEMIVTPEGLNVFPEDVEKVLNAVAGVKESAVVGVAAGKEERPHAVLVLEEGTNAGAVIGEANRHLEPHQHVRTFSEWTADAPLPRTEGTRKLKRRAIREWVESGATAPPAPAAGDELAALLAPYARGRAVTGSTSIEELGLSSLDRVQLLMALEEKLGKPLDERAFTAARTIEELHSLPAAEEEEGPVEFERWSRTRWAYWVRRLNLGLWILPLARVFLWVRRRGLENLEGLEGPVIFASNHQSYFDVPSVLLALPPKWRYRVAPAMRKEFFAAKWDPEKFGRWQWFRKTLSYNLSALMLNAFPLPQRSAGTKEALRYAGELSSEGWHILLFPEGKHSRDETIAPFAPGVAMMAARLGVPVVPVRVRGVNRVLHPDWRMARPGFVTVTVGKPLRLAGSAYPELAREVEQAVREL